MRFCQSQRLDRIRRTSGVRERYGNIAMAHMPGADLLHVSIGAETASESQIAELGEQIGRRRQRILHTENINKTGFGNQRDCFTVSLDIQGITTVSPMSVFAPSAALAGISSILSHGFKSNPDSGSNVT